MPTASASVSTFLKRQTHDECHCSNLRTQHHICSFEALRHSYTMHSAAQAQLCGDISILHSSLQHTHLRLLRNDTKLRIPAAPGVWQENGKLRNVCRDMDTQHEASGQLQKGKHNSAGQLLPLRPTSCTKTCAQNKFCFAGKEPILLCTFNLRTATISFRTAFSPPRQTITFYRGTPV